MDTGNLTMEKIREAQRLLGESPYRSELYPFALSFPQRLGGFDVIQTPTGHWASRRVHSERRNQGKASYHRRIQKKWDKRFGKRFVESAQRKGEVFRFHNRLFIRKDDFGIIAANCVA